MSLLYLNVYEDENGQLTAHTSLHVSPVHVQFFRSTERGRSCASGPQSTLFEFAALFLKPAGDEKAPFKGMRYGWELGVMMGWA